MRLAEKNYNNKEVLIFYILLTGSFGMMVFISGFFPMTSFNNSTSNIHDIPQDINNIKVNASLLYKPLVKRVVFMVIDGLRWDFVKDANKTNAMPITNNLINKNEACLLKVKANAPTVTMPRIKAMTTGSVSRFIDVALNFGKTAVTNDNILLQAKNHGHNLIFYGDDTWLKLFPQVFSRYDGTTSFFVTDFTEVDNNVTRHLNDELNVKNDWSVMIMHYIGLDHIGHVYGPRNPLIKTKLQEMDSIIDTIRKKIEQWNNNGEASLLVICGDHGMKDTGGHGGASPEETLVPLITFGTDCSNNYSDSDNMINQIDMTSILSVFLGIPFPFSSLGSVSINLINHLPLENKLYILHYNAKSILNHFKNIPYYENTQIYRDYLRALNMHTDWLNSNEKSLERSNELIKSYLQVIKDMQEKLTQTMIKYNPTMIFSAIILMIQVLLLTLNFNTKNTFSFKKFLYTCIISTSLWLIFHYIFFNESETSFNITDTDVAKIIFLVLIANCYLCSKMSWSDVLNINMTNANLTFIFIFIYSISVSSSSFVEEEHQVWYFYWATLLLIEIFIYTKNHQYFKISELIYSKGKNIIAIVYLLLQHRILRRWNSTGIQYSNLMDVKTWLKNQDTNIPMSLMLIIALGLLIFLGFTFEHEKHQKIHLIFYFILALFIYLRHMTENSVLHIPFYSKSSGIKEIKIFWIILILYIFYNLYIITKLRRRDNGTLKRLIFLTIKIWIIISALLYRSHNTFLIPMQVITHILMYDFLKYHKYRHTEISINYCLGSVFYFYQGNSNSLATIDVAAGYIGLESYSFLSTSVFLIIHTFSAPILAYLISLYQNISDETEITNIFQKIISLNQKYILLKYFLVLIYTIIITNLRYHLFIWSVFSPKLLYEVAHCTLLFLIIFSVQIICILYKILFYNNNNNNGSMIIKY